MNLRKKTKKKEVRKQAEAEFDRTTWDMTEKNRFAFGYNERLESYLKHNRNSGIQDRFQGVQEVTCVSPGIGGTADVHASHPVPSAGSGQEYIRHIQLSL